MNEEGRGENKRGEREGEEKGEKKPGNQLMGQNRLNKKQITCVFG